MLQRCFTARDNVFDVAKVTCDVPVKAADALRASAERAKRQSDTIAAAACQDGPSGLDDAVREWLERLAAAPLDSEQATSSAMKGDVKAGYNTARAAIWPADQDAGAPVPPVLGDEEVEEDWESEMQAADREEEFSTFQAHYNENSVRCSVQTSQTATVCSLRIMLPSLGFALLQVSLTAALPVDNPYCSCKLMEGRLLQFWVGAASDYPESPALCLMLGAPAVTPGMRLRIMRNVGRRLGTMVGEPMLQPLVEMLSEDDGWLLAQHTTKAEAEAEAEAEPEPEPVAVVVEKEEEEKDEEGGNWDDEEELEPSPEPEPSPDEDGGNWDDEEEEEEEEQEQVEVDEEQEVEQPAAPVGGGGDDDSVAVEDTAGSGAAEEEVAAAVVAFKDIAPEKLTGAMFELPSDELAEHQDVFAGGGGGDKEGGGGGGGKGRVPAVFTDAQLSRFRNPAKLTARAVCSPTEETTCRCIVQVGHLFSAVRCLRRRTSRRASRSTRSSTRCPGASASSSPGRQAAARRRRCLSSSWRSSSASASSSAPSRAGCRPSPSRAESPTSGASTSTAVTARSVTPSEARAGGRPSAGCSSARQACCSGGCSRRTCCWRVPAAARRSRTSSSTRCTSAAWTATTWSACSGT